MSVSKEKLMICERAETCDKRNSDGQSCRHAYPHKKDSGCDIGCCAKIPMGSLCKSVCVQVKKVPMKKFVIEPITLDNARPGMPADHKYLIRYHSHPRFGWLCCRTFKHRTEAVRFSKTQPVQEPT